MYKRILNKALIGFLIILSIFILFSFKNNLLAQTIVEEKVYCNATLDDTFSDNRVLVVLNKNSSNSDIEYNKETFSSYGCTVVKELTNMITTSIKTNSRNSLVNSNNYNKVLCLELSENSKTNVLNVINDLIQREDVIYAGPDYKITIDSTSPNDFFYNNQWAIDSLELANAWDYVKGTRDVLVGVMDTGIDGNHPDLSSLIVNDLCRDFTNGVETNQFNPVDPHGHGTHVAGTIGAIGNNNIGVTGVNWNIGLVSLRVFDENGNGYSSYVANAINYAIQKNISILNLSAGWTEDQKSYDFALESIIDDYNGLLICASGNENKNNDGINPLLPASIDLPNIVSVGSHDHNNNRSVFSNYGEISVDLYAPGEFILSTYPVDICNEYYEFSDGTLLCELDRNLVRMLEYEIESSEEPIDWDYIDENFADIVYLYFKGIIDKDEIVPDLFRTSQHLNTGYHYMDGTSMATPYVTGVAALLLSMNKDLSPIELKTAILQGAEEITITVPKKGVGCAPDSTEEQDALKLNAYNAVKYVLENYMNSPTYTLSNYGGAINASKTITSDASYFDELNGFYKLNVTYSKNYEFISSSTSGIEVTLYDEDFTEVSYNDLDSTSNIVHFIENLNVGTYYFRIKYTDEDCTGTINTEIISRNTVYLSSGVNDILLNTYNGISEYTYPHNQGPGFYKFKLTAGNITSYPSGAIKVYKDQSRTELLDRFETDMISYSASSNVNENEIYVYLPSNGIYYIDILLNNVNYSSVTMEIEEVEVNDLDYSSTLSSPAFNVLFENINKYSYFEKVIIDASSKIQIDVIARGTLNDYVPILLFKEEVDYDTPVNNREYYLDTIFIGEVNPIEYIPCYTFILEPGTYYIGYIDNTDKVFMNIALTRLVEYSDNMDSILVADPYYTGYDLGTEVLFNYGECNTYTITEGFTRNIYLMVEDRLRDPMSRLEYEWYSSNESVATVSSYGTVLARQVEINTTVTIFAVLKEDPSIVYFKEFIILNDEEEELIEIALDMSYSYSEQNGTYQLELNNTNCPYPMIQYYDFEVYEWVQEGEFEVSLNYWGQVTATGPGACVIIGTYKLNPRVKLIINLNII